MSNNNTLHIIFVRHGFTLANLTKRASIFGCIRPRQFCCFYPTQMIKNKFCSDTKLLTLGKHQSRSAGKRMSKLFHSSEYKLHTKEIFTSGLSRTIETAQEFIKAYNKHSTQHILSNITPLPYIGEKRTLCCNDQDNQVQTLEEIQEYFKDRDINIQPWPIPIDPTSTPWKKPNIKAFKNLIPQLADRIQDANTIIVISHKYTIRSLLNRTLNNGEMILQSFDKSTGKKVNGPIPIKGYQHFSPCVQNSMVNTNDVYIETGIYS